MLWFNTGELFTNPVGGNQATNPTPIHVGTMQDISVAFDQAIKELWGSYNTPDDVAPGRLKITGKFSFGALDIDLFNNVMFGQAVTTGIKLIQTQVTTVPAVTPFTVTVTNSATFLTDLGVSYANGQNFQKVASPSAAGQYSVAAGVYTFDTADAGASISITYTSTEATTGRTLTVTRQQMGFGPSFEMYLENSYQGTGNGLHLFSCRISKLNVPVKQDDYTKSEFDFECYSNAAGQIHEWYQTAP